MPSGNTKHKDRLFTYLYGSPENAPWLLSLYNAVNGTSRVDASAIELTTIDTVMYMSMHNDVSFVVAGEMSLYEQQSTYNPNMPLRMLQYLASLYEKHIVKTKQNKFGRTQLALPSTRLVVFYNGINELPDEVMLSLSDSFPPGSISDVEVKVKMMNINLGRSKMLLEGCKTLGEYSWLVNEIRERGKEEDDLAAVIDKAIEAMPNGFEIKPFLVAHKAEVRGMLLTEYDEARTMELFRQEGMKAGRLESFAELVGDGLLSAGVAAERLGMSEDEFLRRCASRATVPDAPGSSRSGM